MLFMCHPASSDHDAAPAVVMNGISFRNGGSTYHTLKIKGTALELKANPGKTETGTVTLSKGTYDFECTVSGHAQAGMKGTLVVG